MCSERHAEHIFIAFSAGSKRMQKAAAAADLIESTRAHQGSLYLRTVHDQQRSSCS